MLILLLIASPPTNGWSFYFIASAATSWLAFLLNDSSVGQLERRPEFLGARKVVVPNQLQRLVAKRAVPVAHLDRVFLDVTTLRRDACKSGQAEQVERFAVHF
eukprot:GHVT01005583.1.p2 GENE.GHVT01005583.1~~GHVT01005583.1.p2  ORF type:complete len:103 (-),score=13.81 GHVT01005583.1:530-838(-)